MQPQEPPDGVWRAGRPKGVTHRCAAEGWVVPEPVIRRWAVSGLFPRRHDDCPKAEGWVVMAGLFGVTEIEASVTDSDGNQAAAQDGQTSDHDSEKTSGNAIKATHDTPLASKRDGADQLIKTFGIPTKT
jgi:hypothetical protein